MQTRAAWGGFQGETPTPAPRPRQTMSLISLDFSLVLNPGVLAGAQRQEEAVRRKAEETGPQCLQGSPP